jgi:hypothetical protein
MPSIDWILLKKQDFQEHALTHHGSASLQNNIQRDTTKVAMLDALRGRIRCDRTCSAD